MDFSHSISAPRISVTTPLAPATSSPSLTSLTSLGRRCHVPAPLPIEPYWPARLGLAKIFIMWVVALRPPRMASPALGNTRFGVTKGRRLRIWALWCRKWPPEHKSDSSQWVKGRNGGVGWLNGGFWQLGAGRCQRSGGEWPSSCCNGWSVAWWNYSEVYYCSWLLYWRPSVWGETKLGWIGCTTTAIEPSMPTIELIPATVADSSSDNGYDRKLH